MQRPVGPRERLAGERGPDADAGHREGPPCTRLPLALNGCCECDAPSVAENRNELPPRSGLVDALSCLRGMGPGLRASRGSEGCPSVHPPLPLSRSLCFPKL